MKNILYVLSCAFLCSSVIASGEVSEIGIESETESESELDYSIHVDIVAMGQYIDQKNGLCNTYIGELLNITSDIRFNDDFGLNINVVSDKRCINDRLPEINTAYLYYVFDMLGEIHIGHDRPIDQYINSIDQNVFENRSISSYFNCPVEIFSKYSIADDHSALRATWLSPTVNGFKLGLSYIPNSSVCRGISKHYTRDLIGFGASYEGGRDSFKYGASAIQYFARAYNANTRSVQATWCEGFVGYKGLTLSGRIIFDGNSLQQLSQDRPSTTYGLDISYTKKNTTFLVGHTISHKYNETFRAYTTSIQQKIGNNTLFTQYKHLHSKNNKGHIIMIGMSRKMNWEN